MPNFHRTRPRAIPQYNALVTDMLDKTACFTGHRPAKLPWGLNERAPECRAFRSRLLREITSLVDCGYERFITGMAQGIDTYAVEILVNLRKRCPQITIEAAIPCPRQEGAWPKKDQHRYRSLLRQTDAQTLLSDSYFNGCMQRRNVYMVDRSSVVIAAWNGEKTGGTWNTIRYAMSKGKEIRYVPL